MSTIKEIRIGSYLEMRFIERNFLDVTLCNANPFSSNYRQIARNLGKKFTLYFLTRNCRDKIDLNGNVPKCPLFSVTVLLRAQMYLLDFNVWPLEILYFKRNQIRSKLKPVQLSNDEVSLTGMVNCVLLLNSANSHHESASCTSRISQCTDR